MYVNVNSIHDIETTKEQVKIALDVCLFVKGESHEIAKPIAEEIFEEMHFIRSVQEEKIKEEMTALDDDEDDRPAGLLPGVYRYEMGYTITMKTDFDFGSFPFDVQDFHLQMYVGLDEYNFMSAAGEQFWEKNAKNGYARALGVVPSALINEEWTLHPPFLYYDVTDPHVGQTVLKTHTQTLGAEWEGFRGRRRSRGVWRGTHTHTTLAHLLTSSSFCCYCFFS